MLVSVLGILDFVITWRQQPTIKVIAWSLGIAITLLGLAVIIQQPMNPSRKIYRSGQTHLISKERE